MKPTYPITSNMNNSSSSIYFNSIYFPNFTGISSSTSFLFCRDTSAGQVTSLEKMLVMQEAIDLSRKYTLSHENQNNLPPKLRAGPQRQSGIPQRAGTNSQSEVWAPGTLRGFLGLAICFFSQIRVIFSHYSLE